MITKLPYLTIDLIDYLERLYPLQALTKNDVINKSLEQIAFEAGQRQVIEMLKSKFEELKDEQNKGDYDV